MISTAQLLLPLFASAVLVFIASSLIHMLFQWHKADYKQLSNEDEVAAALRKSGAAPGTYVIPFCLGMKEMQSPEMQKKFIDGPIGFITLKAPGIPGMGKSLGQWFALTVFVSAVVACICGTVLGPGAMESRVFHVAGLIAFAAYATGSISDGIWYARPWGNVARDLLDALIYALVTGGTFAVLWPS